MHNPYRIIDIHAHVFPEKVAQKAVEAIGVFYNLGMQAAGRKGGTCADLLASGGKIGVERYVIHSVATRADQAASINSFIISCQNANNRFVGFGTLHPYMDGLEEEVERIIALGLRGVKLHPDFQSFNIDDPRALALYRRIAGRLPLLIHMGDETRDYSAPPRLRRVLDAIPALTVIAAHLGGYRRWNEAKQYLVGSPAFFDTSSSLFLLPAAEAEEIILSHGVEKVLWGSDYPMWLHEDELNRFMALRLGETEKRAILWGNSARLLGLA